MRRVSARKPFFAFASDLDNKTLVFDFDFDFNFNFDFVDDPPVLWRVLCETNLGKNITK